MKQIFISSVQKEFKDERRALKDFIHGDALLRRFFEVFLFEDLPASDRRVDDVYLDEVDRCDIYVGLFGNEYGSEDSEGISPTEREFDRATKAGKERLIFIKKCDDSVRHKNMSALVRKAERLVIRRQFDNGPELTAELYASLIEYLGRTGAITTRPFDAAACAGATLAGLSEEKVFDFLERAKSARGYALGPETPMPKVLAHLNLLDGDRPSNAAVLLFGREPQRFLPTSIIKCLHFHGTQIQKPIPSYQVYKGTVFEMVGQAVDFVLSKLNRRVGTRDKGPQAPVTYDLPPDAVAEAIVNAIAHRDYSSNASVQIMLFSDRLEVWNPGHLPPPLTFDLLRKPHPSIPHNPLIAEPLFLTRLIERAGTGTLDMAKLCKEADLPPPEFRESGGQFIQAIRRDWLTNRVLAELKLNERQIEALAFVRKHERIGNKQYQGLFAVSKPTATRDLDELTKKGVFIKVGATGKGTYYVLSDKGLIKGSKGSQRAHEGKGKTQNKPDTSRRKKVSRRAPRYAKGSKKGS